VTAGRIHLLPASPCASLDLVPIDHVIGGLTDIAERMAASGRTYHLVSSAPVPVAVLRTLALGYQHLHAPRFAAVGIWTIAARSTHHTQGPINFASRSAPADNQVVGASKSRRKALQRIDLSGSLVTRQRAVRDRKIGCCLATRRWITGREGAKYQDRDR
jgi:hypothetical protein